MGKVPDPQSASNQEPRASEGTAAAEPASSREGVSQIVALVKPFRAEAVLAALSQVEILAGTVREAMGYGRQKHHLHRYLGSEYDASFLPKVEISVFVHGRDVAAAVRAIVSHARTGRIGDGKILVLGCHPSVVEWDGDGALSPMSAEPLPPPMMPDFNEEC